MVKQCHFVSHKADVKIKHATITASVGEPVTLEVETTLDHNDITWRKDGYSMSIGDGSTSIEFASVEVSDAGIYECHEVGQQSAGKHAIMRLIVRGICYEFILFQFSKLISVQVLNI